MLELLGQCVDIVLGEQGYKVRRIGRIAPKQLNRVFPLEDAGNLITGHQNRNAPLGASHPLRQLSLRVGIRAIHFIQNQTQGSHVASKERRDTSCMGAGLRQGVNIGETAKGLRGIQLQRLKPRRER